MKHIFTLCAAAAVSLQLQAQTTGLPKGKLPVSQTAAMVLHAQLSGNNGLKTTATAKRIKSTAWRLAPQGNPGDSVIHYYRQYKGSYLPTEAAYWSNTQYMEATFNASDPVSLQYIMSDSSVTYTNVGNAMKVYGKVKYDYDATGLRLACHDEIDAARMYVVTNDNMGRRAKVLTRDSIMSGKFTDETTNYFVYDNNGRILLDTAVDISTGFTVSKTEYSYNAGGYPVKVSFSYAGPNGWVPEIKHEIDYDAANRVTYVTGYMYDGISAWEALERTRYEYAATGPQYIHKVFEKMDTKTMVWYPESGERLTLNSNGTVAMKYNLQYFLSGAEDTIFRSAYLYNSSNLYDRVLRAVPMGGGNFSEPDTIYYHYEDYELSGINNVAANNAAFSVYPNPASSVLNVRFDPGFKPTGYTIVDLTGKVAARQLYNTNNMVDVSALPAGTYIITANGTGQHRQFVIAR